MIRKLVLKNRSYRRFDHTHRISTTILRRLVDLARLTPSGRNGQPLKYMLVSSEEACSRIYPQLSWAAYLKDWDGPEENERPTAYVIVLGDKTIAENFGIDPGIAMQTILLGAVEKGLGGCILGSIKRKEIQEIFDIPSHFEILYVIALGKPVERIVIDEVRPGGEIKYWRDEERVHHVPKRVLAEVIVGEE